MTGPLKVLAGGSSDVFPQTIRTWYDAQLQQGDDGRDAVNQHLMQTYAFPLKVYFMGTSMRWLGEPDDVVNGFFASRLVQAEFLSKWQASGMRLRRWLMNALGFYLHELRKQRLRDSRGGGGTGVDVPDVEATSEDNPEAAADAAAASAFVREALDDTRQSLVQAGHEAHWNAFIRHCLDGVSFKQVGEELGVDAQRADVMHRTALRRFRKALEEVLRRDGVSPGELDQEIHALLEAMQQ